MQYSKHINRFAANELFRGIRVSSGLVRELMADSDVTDLKLLADHDLALDVNGGPDTPAVVAELAARLPE